MLCSVTSLSKPLPFLDVGGGSVPNGTRNSLARIPLRWMIRECFKCDTGIIFDAAQLQQAGLRIVMEDGKPILADLPERILLHVPPYSGDGRDNQKPGLFWDVVQHVKDLVKYGVSVVKSFFWRKFLINHHSTPITGLPQVGGKELDLHTLYKEVTQHGGLESVCIAI